MEGAGLSPVTLGVEAEDPQAAATLARGLEGCDPALVLLFGSPRTALDPLARQLSGMLPGARMAGCSSAEQAAPGATYCWQTSCKKAPKAHRLPRHRASSFVPSGSTQVCPSSRQGRQRAEAASQ